jgi:hypothetical protein
MRVSATKSAQRVERNQYLSYKRIKGYGLGNSYPQKILEIVNSSGTGKVCMDIYIKFIEGAGFVDQALSELIINSNKEKLNTLLSKCAKDLRYFNGFAVLVKYDFKAIPIEFYNVPFEHCRIEIDSDLSYTGKIAVYPDWTNITGKIFNQDDVKFINRYDPERVAEQIIEAGGPEKYLGQILYFTSDGDFEYPICPVDPVITDMLTEESVSTVKHRNAKNNFLPSGILVRKGIKPRTLNDGSIDPKSPYNQQQEESAAEIKRMQGDENTSKIWVVDVDSDEEVPQFIDFTAKNYDRQYELTEKTVQDNIGKMNMVPPILRGVDIGAGFGADLMTNAYNFMSSVTGTERRKLKEVFVNLFEFYPAKFADFTIAPLKYVEDVPVNKPAI